MADMAEGAQVERDGGRSGTCPTSASGSFAPHRPHITPTTKQTVNLCLFWPPPSGPALSSLASISKTTNCLWDRTENQSDPNGAYDAKQIHMATVYPDEFVNFKQPNEWLSLSTTQISQSFRAGCKTYGSSLSQVLFSSNRTSQCYIIPIQFSAHCFLARRLGSVPPAGFTSLCTLLPVPSNRPSHHGVLNAWRLHCPVEKLQGLDSFISLIFTAVKVKDHAASKRVGALAFKEARQSSSTCSLRRDKSRAVRLLFFDNTTFTRKMTLFLKILYKSQPKIVNLILKADSIFCNFVRPLLETFSKDIIL
ncbi:unnamed protein product, partial [Nesidiocoris tenuis]